MRAAFSCEGGPFSIGVLLVFAIANFHMVSSDADDPEL